MISLPFCNILSKSACKFVSLKPKSVLLVTAKWKKKSFKMLKNQHVSHSIYLLERMQATTIQKICSVTSDFSLSLLLFLRRYLYNEFSCLTRNHMPKFCVNENAGYGLFQRAVSAAIHSILVFLRDSQLSQLCLSCATGVCTDRLSWSK